MNSQSTTTTQEDMELWFKQLTNTLLNQGIIKEIAPVFIACNYEERWAELAFSVMPWELNSWDILHSGITTTAVDTVLGMLCHYFVKPYIATTVNLNTTFHKPILANDTFLVRGKIDFLGHSLTTLSGEVFIEKGTVLALTATTTFKVLHKTLDIPLT